MCNTVITLTAAQSEFSFCVLVTADKLTDQKYPAILELNWQDAAGNWHSQWLGGGYLSGTKICYNASLNSPYSAFYNVGTNAQIYARTANVLIDQLDPENEFYGMYMDSIYAEIKGDPANWCMSNSILVSFTSPLPGKGKGRGNNKNK